MNQHQHTKCVQSDSKARSKFVVQVNLINPKGPQNLKFTYILLYKSNKIYNLTIDVATAKTWTIQKFAHDNLLQRYRTSTAQVRKNDVKRWQYDITSILSSTLFISSKRWKGPYEAIIHFSIALFLTIYVLKLLSKHIKNFKMTRIINHSTSQIHNKICLLSTIFVPEIIWFSKVLHKAIYNNAALVKCLLLTM